MVEYTLFNGSFTINTQTKAFGTLSKLTQKPPNEFNLLGLKINITKLGFTQSGNGIELGAKLTAPELGILETAALDIDPITISTDGVSVGQASFAPWTGKREFNAFGLMSLAVENPKLSFDFQVEVGNLQGKIYIPTLNNLTADLTGNKGLKFRRSQNNTPEYALDVTIQNGVIPIFKDWKFDQINADLTKSFDGATITGSLSAQLYTAKDKFITVTGAYNKVNPTDKNGVFSLVADSGIGTDFTLFGTDIDIKKVIFISDINLTDDDAWTPKVTLTEALMTLPEFLGTNEINGKKERIQVSLKDLEITENGFSIREAKVAIPDFSVNLLG